MLKPVSPFTTIDDGVVDEEMIKETTTAGMIPIDIHNASITIPGIATPPHIAQWGTPPHRSPPGVREGLFANAERLVVVLHTLAVGLFLPNPPPPPGPPRDSDG